MTTTVEDRIARLPPRLESEFVMASADEPIRLAAGGIELSRGGRALGHLDGELTLKWVPKLRIECVGQSDAAFEDLWDHECVDLRVPEIGLTAEALVTSINLRFAKAHNIRALLKGAENPNLRETEQFRFYLVNFPCFFGEPVRTGSGPHAVSSRDRLRMTAGPLVCTIDRIVQAGHSDQEGGKPGYLITHVGEIRRPGQALKPREVHELLGALYWLFAFVRGARTGPVLPSVEPPFARHWISIAPCRVDEPRRVEGWLPTHNVVDLDSLFAGFLDKWSDAAWNEGLRTTLAWYVAANAPGTPNEARILLCQIALEVLASLQGFENGDAHERIRDLLNALGIPVAVPSRLGALACYTAQVGLGEPSQPRDASTCLTQLRNKFEHPTAKHRQHLGKVDGLVRHQAAQCGLELFELSMLAILGYRGKYVRRAFQGWKGDDEVPVPWT